jgi:hypothetical protein
MATLIVLSVWWAGEPLRDRLWHGDSNEHGAPPRRCACPLAEDAERVLEDGRLCPYPADAEDGLCATCRFTCIPLLKELREGNRRG